MRSRETILAELRMLRAALEDQTALATQLYRRRLAAFRAGRDLDPPITQRELAEAAGVSEPAVIGQLRKLREEDGAL